MRKQAAGDYVRTSITLPKKVCEELKAMADADMISFSSAVLAAIRERLAVRPTVVAVVSKPVIPPPDTYHLTHLEHSGSFVRILKGRWVATLAAEEVIRDGQCISLFSGGRVVAVVSSECDLQPCRALPGDPNMREFGERKPIIPEPRG